MRLFQGKPLFPSLQELHWYIQPPVSAGIIFVVTSALRRLTVCYGGDGGNSRTWRYTQQKLFRTIFDAAPKLTYLAVNDTHPAIIPACLSSIQVLDELRVLSLDNAACISSDVLSTLSRLERLEELTFAVKPKEGSLVDFRGFPRLKTLDMSVLNGSTRSIICRFSSPELRKLTLLTPENVVDPDEFLHIATELSKSFPSMEQLSWTFSYPSAAPFEVAPPLETALAPLLPLRMTSVSLVFDEPIPDALSDETFHVIAKSWPRLVYLRITDGFGDTPRPFETNVTWRSLITLAQGCTQLEQLYLGKMKVLGLEQELRDCPVLQHPLQELIVDWPGIPIEEESACALLLDRLFPSLDAPPLRGHESETGWDRVLQSVWLCRAGRSNRAS